MVSVEEIVSALVENNYCSADDAQAFAELAVKGASGDKKEQMRRLLDKYIENCGISLGARTVYNDACEGLFYSYPENEGELLFDHYGELNPDYTSDYDRYDICGMDNEEEIGIALEEVRTGMCDEPTSYALCYGLWLTIKRCYIDRNWGEETEEEE